MIYGINCAIHTVLMLNIGNKYLFDAIQYIAQNIVWC